MDQLEAVLYAIGQIRDVQRGETKHLKRDSELAEQIISLMCIEPETIKRLAQEYAYKLDHQDYDGAADDWDANRIRYIYKILEYIIENNF